MSLVARENFDTEMLWTNSNGSRIDELVTELDQKVTLDHQKKRYEERFKLWGVDVSRF